MASRTDRGVHARANVLALSSEVPGGPLLAALNGIAPDLWATRAARVAPGFRVRLARSRWYRYFERASPAPLARWRAAAACFDGPVDVRSFARGVPGGRPAVRAVTSVTVRRRPGGLIVDVRAPAFVWGMVRKIVAALRAHAEGELPLERLRSAVAGRERLMLPLAEPERLVLWEVRPTVRWTRRAPDRPFRPWRHLAEESERAAVRAVILREIAPAGAAASAPSRPA